MKRRQRGEDGIDGRVDGDAGRGVAAKSGRSSKPRGDARSSASSLARTSCARAMTAGGRPASFATWMP
jgi:hypothetical protein